LCFHDHVTSGTLAAVVDDHLRGHGSLALTLPDGTVLGAEEARARLVVRSPDALRRIVTAPGELGFARAYVAGEIDLEGDIYSALPALLELPSARHLARRQRGEMVGDTVHQGSGHFRRRPKRPSCAGGGIRVAATRLPSRITTTSRTPSTASCSGHR
jgi:hypothetical protein